MNSVFDKIKFWTKIVVFSLIGLYVIGLFIANQHAVIDPGLNLLFVYKPKPNVLLVLLITAVGSVFGWWLLKLVFRAVRQFRQMRARSRTNRLEHDVAEMKAKAQTLQTSSQPPQTPSAPL